MSAHHGPSSTEDRHYRHEGPKNHYLSFVLSILLTMLAFAAVIYGGLDRAFVLWFIVILAIVQAVFQLVYWMHMKDRGHTYAILFMSMGAVIALTAFAAAVYWMWW